MDSKETCLRLGLPHSYWPQGNCAYCGVLAPPLAAKNAEISRLTDVLVEAKRAASVMEKNIYPKPDVGPDHPYSIFLALEAAIAKAEPK